MATFYRFCKNEKEQKYPMYSMGNDYGVIRRKSKT